MKKLSLFALCVAMLTSLLPAQAVVDAVQYGTPGPLEPSLYTSTQDATGNYYLASIWPCITLKLNGSGVLQYSDYYKLGASESFAPGSMVVGTAGDLFQLGSHDFDAGTYNSLLRIIRSNGQEGPIQEGAGVHNAWGIAPDSTGNVLLGTYTTAGGGAYSLQVEKLSVGSLAVLTTQTVATVHLLPDAIDVLYSDHKGHVYVDYQGDSGRVLASIDESTCAVRWSVPTVQASACAILPDGDLLRLYSSSQASGATSVLERVGWSKGLSLQKAPLMQGATAFPLAGSFLNIDLQGNSYCLLGPRVAKINLAGQVLWTYALPSEEICGLAQTLAGGVFVTTYTETNYSILRAFSPAGALLWAQNRIDGTAPGVFADKGGNAAVVSTVMDSQMEHRMVVHRYRGSDGTSLGSSDPTLTGIMQSSLTLLGNEAGATYVFGLENYTPFVAKLTSSGAITWKSMLPKLLGHQFIVGTASPSGQSAVITQSPSGAYLATKLDGSGTVLWMSTYGPSFPSNVLIDSSGNVDVCVTALQSVTVDQLGALKGTLDWKKVFSGPNSVSQGYLDSADGISIAGSVAHEAAFHIYRVSSTGVASTLSYALPSGTFSVGSMEIDPVSGDELVAGEGNVPVASGSSNALRLFRCRQDQSLPWSSSLPIADTFNGIEARFCAANNSVVVRCTPSAGTFQNIYEYVQQFNAATGANTWQNTFVLGTSQYISPSMATDSFGNVVLAELLYPANFAQPVTQVRKIDGLTGVDRWTTSQFGALTFHATRPGGITVDANNMPIIVGLTPSSADLTIKNGFYVHFANAPTAHPGTMSVAKNGYVTGFNLLANDEDVSGVTASLVKSPIHVSHFQISAAGLVLYVPVAGFAGTDSFTYKVTNTYGSSQATVTVTVK